MVWLPEGHLAYFILELVEQLDLGKIERSIQSKDARGTRTYSPVMMTALLLYAYSADVYSSRKIERATYEHVGFRALAGGEHPYFTTINEFRKAHDGTLSFLFVQVLRLCQKAGLVKLGHVAMDGTKVQANASKHKAMSYARMEEAEARASRAAALRDQARGARERAHPEQQQKVRRANRTRAQRCEEQAAELEQGEADDFLTPQGLAKHRVRARPDGTPHPKAQRNFVDPDSRIMEQGGAFL
ncbi:MAG: transposase [Thermoanaerobaculia bacterium]